MNLTADRQRPTPCRISSTPFSLVYIDDRPYTVGGVLAEQGSVESGISAEEAIFIPYATGIKYLTGSDLSPTITVIAKDVDNIAARLPLLRHIPTRSSPFPMRAAKWKLPTSQTRP